MAAKKKAARKAPRKRAAPAPASLSSSDAGVQEQPAPSVTRQVRRDGARVATS